MSCRCRTKRTRLVVSRVLPAPTNSLQQGHVRATYNSIISIMSLSMSEGGAKVASVIVEDEAATMPLTNIAW